MIDGASHDAHASHPDEFARFVGDAIRRAFSLGRMGHPRPVTLTTGLPETVLDPEPGQASAALAEALGRPGAEQRDAVAAVDTGGPG